MPQTVEVPVEVPEPVEAPVEAAEPAEPVEAAEPIPEPTDYAPTFLSDPYLESSNSTTAPDELSDLRSRMQQAMKSKIAEAQAETNLSSEQFLSIDTSSS